MVSETLVKESIKWAIPSGEDRVACKLCNGDISQNIDQSLVQEVETTLQGL